MNLKLTLRVLGLLAAFVFVGLQAGHALADGPEKGKPADKPLIQGAQGGGDGGLNAGGKSPSNPDQLGSDKPLTQQTQIASSGQVATTQGPAFFDGNNGCGQDRRFDAAPDPQGGFDDNNGNCGGGGGQQAVISTPGNNPGGGGGDPGNNAPGGGSIGDRTKPGVVPSVDIPSEVSGGVIIQTQDPGIMVLGTSPITPLFVGVPGGAALVQGGIPSLVAIPQSTQPAPSLQSEVSGARMLTPAPALPAGQGVGASVRPPSTGDGGLVSPSRSSLDEATFAGLVLATAGLAAVFGLKRLKTPA